MFRRFSLYIQVSLIIGLAVGTTEKVDFTTALRVYYILLDLFISKNIMEWSDKCVAELSNL